MLTILGASPAEIGLVAVLVAIVLLAPIVPKIGERLGGFFD